MSILTVTFSFAQEIKHSDLATASRGEFTSYIASDGAVYKIGDRIKIGVPSSNKTFAFITEGGGLLLPITNLTAASSGQETEIKKRFGLLVTRELVTQFLLEPKVLLAYLIIQFNLKTHFRQEKLKDLE
jgi:hypothetical protein